MVQSNQQVSGQGIRILALYVGAYVLIGSYMYFSMELPAIAYVIYAIIGWVAGMAVFYKLHRDYMRQLG